MKWTDAEIDQLKAKYADTPTELLATSIGRPVRQVYQKAHALGLFKSAEYLAGPHASRLRRGDNVGASYRFKKGQQAWNKGMKGLDLSGGKGQFKKGQMSGAAQHNYKPIGSFRISKDGYLEKKITDDQSIAPARRWVGVHRLVWEAANGPIPLGHVVVFQAGKQSKDVEKITLDCLELITRAELMSRNTYHRYPKEIANLIQLRGALTRQINRRLQDEQH